MYVDVYIFCLVLNIYFSWSNFNNICPLKVKITYAVLRFTKRSIWNKNTSVRFRYQIPNLYTELREQGVRGNISKMAYIKTSHLYFARDLDQLHNIGWYHKDSRNISVFFYILNLESSCLWDSSSCVGYQQLERLDTDLDYLSGNLRKINISFISTRIMFKIVVKPHICATDARNYDAGICMMYDRRTELAVFCLSVRKKTILLWTHEIACTSKTGDPCGFFPRLTTNFLL